MEGAPQLGQRGPAPARDSEINAEILLKLKVYRSLGIDVERNKVDGEYTKAVIRNRGKGDMCVVNVDPKFSKFFYANYFWDRI